MADLIIGMGEVGSTLYDLLEQRGFHCIGYDIDDSKCKNYDVNDRPKIECLHICTPYKDGMEGMILAHAEQNYPDFIMIHSTVKPGTTRTTQELVDVPVIYSPTNGVHKTFLQDMIYYPKFYASASVIFPVNEIKKRFFKTKSVNDTTKLERTKILVDTTYYGWLIIYRRMCEKIGPVYWEFAEEIHKKLGNRPIMYNDHKPIGGHCVTQNLDLLEDNEISDLIRKYGKGSG